MARLEGERRAQLAVSGQLATNLPVKRVMTLALPAVGEQLLNMMVGLTDTYLVGHLGATATAAVGLSNQLIMLATTLFSAIAVGATALIARATGAGDEKLANRVLSQSLLIGIIMGGIATLLGLLSGEWQLRMLGTPPEVIPLASEYFRIVSFSMVLSSLTFIGNAALRGSGDTRTPLLVMLVVNVINLVLTWALIGGHFGLPAVGVAGSAWGQAIGRLAGGALVVAMLVRGRGLLKLRPALPDMDILRRLLKVGAPAAGEQLIFRFGMLSFAGIVTSIGTVAYAAHTIGIQAESVSWLPGFGFAVAATTLVGQELGAGRPEEARRNGFTAYTIGALFMSSLGVVLFCFPEFFIGFFTSDPAVVEAGRLPLRIMAVAQPILASTMIFNGGLRGAGDTRWVLVASMIGVWGVRVPLAYVLVKVLGMGLEGAWAAMAVDQAVRGSLAFARFRSGHWQTIKV